MYLEINEISFFYTSLYLSMTQYYLERKWISFLKSWNDVSNIEMTILEFRNYLFFGSIGLLMVAPLASYIICKKSGGREGGSRWDKTLNGNGTQSFINTTSH